MKHIRDKSQIPTFFSNKRYDQYYKKYFVKILAIEIEARQSLSRGINSLFEDDDIERSKKRYLKELSGFTEPYCIEHPTLGLIPNSKKPIELFPRLLWDGRPYIQPIKEIYDDKNLDQRSKFAFRSNLDAYDEYPAVSFNLDFSDDLILSDVKKYLKNKREELNHRPKLLPPKEFIKKFKSFRTLQVIDVLLWQKLTNQHIQYDTLANFLFPNGQHTGKQLRETIIPFANKLLNKESNEYAYLLYLSDKSSEK